MVEGFFFDRVESYARSPAIYFAVQDAALIYSYHAGAAAAVGDNTFVRAEMAVYAAGVQLLVIEGFVHPAPFSLDPALRRRRVQAYLRNLFSSFMNWPTSLNCRYTDANLT